MRVANGHTPVTPYDVKNKSSSRRCRTIGVLCIHSLTDIASLEERSAYFG